MHIKETRTKKISHSIIALMFLIIGWVCPGLSQNLPRVIILATGGTIAGQGAGATSAGYIPGKLQIEELLNSIPSVNEIATIKGEQISSVGSFDMTIPIWLKLAKRVNEIFANNEADGIVITHGTDTQEETAYFLSLTVNQNKPVVLTGSMRAATALSADGPKNLFDAILVAGDPLSKDRGVMVSFNESIFEGSTAVKLNTTNVDAFGSPNTGAIGHVYGGKVFYYHSNPNKSVKHPIFDISNLDSLPKVEIAYMYADASATAIEAFVEHHVDGLIIAGTGNGSFNQAIRNVVIDAITKGIVVVRSTRVASGRVTQTSQVFDDQKLGTIAADDLNPQKGRILLMLALTTTRDKGRIQQMFLDY